MCEAGDQVLSDVHVNFPPFSRLLQEERATTRFYFEIPKTADQLNPSLTTEPDTVKNADWPNAEGSLLSRQPGPHDGNETVTMATVDEDGDLTVVRKRRRVMEENVITIEHAMATTLKDVGLQVWQGCLLLCDFFLTHREIFRDQVALELGAGVGLSSIVMGAMAAHVFCTDVGKCILDTCQRNIVNNLCHLLDQEESQKQPVVQVRELDWFKSIENTDHFGPYQWDDEDRERLKDVTIIIAADVVYDDDLTDAFFNTLCRLMAAGKDKTAIIALEKRLNFTISDLDVTCEAYDHFRRHIARLATSEDTGDVRYSVQQLPVDFPQCFEYKRTKQLVVKSLAVSSLHRCRQTAMVYEIAQKMS